jgi:Fe-Mn family superoxide dismutase
LTVIAANHGGIEQLKSSISAAAMGMFTSGYIWFVSDKNGNTSILPTFGPGTLLVRSRQLVAKGHGALYTELKIDPLAWDRDMEYVDKYMAEWLDDLSDSEGEEDSEGEKENQEKASNAKNGQRSLPSKSASGPIPRFLHTTANRATGFESPAVPNVFNYTKSEDTIPSRPKTAVDALNSGDVLYPLFCISVHEHAWLYAGFGIWGKEAWLREFWTVLNWKQVSSAYADITAPSQ